MQDVATQEDLTGKDGLALTGQPWEAHLIYFSCFCGPACPLQAVGFQDTTVVCKRYHTAEVAADGVKGRLQAKGYSRGMSVQPRERGGGGFPAQEANQEGEPGDQRVARRQRVAQRPGDAGKGGRRVSSSGPAKGTQTSGYGKAEGVAGTKEVQGVGRGGDRQTRRAS